MKRNGVLRNWLTFLPLGVVLSCSDGVVPTAPVTGAGPQASLLGTLASVANLPPVALASGP